MQKIPLTVYLKLVCVALFWGATFIAGRIVSPEIPHMIAAAGRFVVACAFLIVVAWHVEGGLPKLSRKQMHATFGLGATGIFLYNICFLGALERMPAGRSVLFVSLSPIVTALTMSLIFRERLGASKWLGIVIAFIGAGVVITKGDLLQVFQDISHSFGTGESLMLGAVFSWTAYTILGKQALKGLSPIAAATYASLWGLLLLLLGAVNEIPQLNVTHLTWQVISSILFLGIFGTVISFIWYYEGVKILGPARTAVFNNLVPVFGVALSSLVLNEPILISMIVGGLLVITGVSLTNRKTSA